MAYKTRLFLQITCAIILLLIGYGAFLTNRLAYGGFAFSMGPFCYLCGMIYQERQARRFERQPLGTPLWGERKMMSDT